MGGGYYALGWTSGVQFSAGAVMGFFSLHRVHTGSGAHILYYGYRGLSGRGVKLTTHFHLVPKLMRGAKPPLLQYVFIAWCVIKEEMHLHGVVFG
jgi:hypothetical protein